MKKPTFTQEELFYIESIMDINAAIGNDKISKYCEQFMMAKAMEKEDFCKLISDGILELGRSQLVTKSIRDKIEKWKYYKQT